MKQNDRKKQDARKIQKKVNKSCPECGEKHLVITERHTTANGVIYFDKYYECLASGCDFIELIKDKKKYSKKDIIDSELM